MNLTPEDVAQCRAIAVAWRDQMARIIAAVSDESGVQRSAIIGRRRSTCIDRARQIVMFIADRQEIPHHAIARHLGRDQSTIRHGINAEAKRRSNAGMMPKPTGPRLTAKPKGGAA